MSNLYEGVDEFRLIDVDEIVNALPTNFLIIEEPAGWDGLNIVLDRDPEDRGGVNFEFGDDESLLRFDKAAGKSFIEEIELIVGSDFNISLEYTNDGIVIFTGGLIGSSAQRSDSDTGYRVKRFDFGNKLLTRFDSIINLESAKDFDDNAITPFTIRQIPLHSKSIQLIEDRSSEARDADDLIGVDFITGNAFPMDDINNNDEEQLGYFMPNFSVVTSNDIPSFFEYGNVGFGRNADTTLADADPLSGVFAGSTPRENKIFLFEETEVISEYDFDFDVNVEVLVGTNQVNARDTFTTLSFLCQAVIVVENTAGVVQSIFTLDSQTIDYFDVEKTESLDLTGSVTIDMIRGDRVYFYVVINPFATGVVINGGSDNIVFFITEIKDTTNIQFIGKTKEIPTLVEGGYFNEILDKGLEYITGNTVVLVSSFFKNRVVDGVANACGGLNFITSGFKIRQFPENLTVIIESLISLAISRYGCGFAINQVAGVTKLLLEEQSFFFQNKKILSITDTRNPIIRKVNKEILFNESLSGFKKFAKPNERGTVEGINTQSLHLFPIEKDKKKINLLSDVIADGTEIERVRRNGLKNRSDESDEKDDDLFVVKVGEFNNSFMYDPSLYGSGNDFNIQRDAANFRIIINGLIIQGLSSGDFINIDSQTNRQFSGTPILDFENNRTILPTSGETQNDIIFNKFNFRESNDSTEIHTYNPERLEGFNNVTGLIDKNSEYNIDHAPTQFLIHNFSWFGGSMLKKAGTKVLKFLKKKNTTILSRAYDSATCSLTTDLIAENDDLLLSAMRTRSTEFFTEFIYEIEARISFTDLTILKEALRNEAVADINYGFIDFIDVDGTTVQAYPFRVEYNPVNENVNIIAWGKNN